jgi:hypothetical protein
LVCLVGQTRHDLLEEPFVANGLIGLLFDQFLQASIHQVGVIGDAFADLGL